MLRFLISSSIVLLLSVSVFAQEQKVEITKFGGLNTRDGDLVIQPNEARLAHNVDWSRNLNAITKRYGYDSVSAFVGADSIIAIFPAVYSDGSKQLIFVTDSADVGYGHVYATNKGSYNMEADSITKLWDTYSVTHKVSFSILDDAVFIANGLQKTIVYYNDVARSFPISSPGEPTIIPLTTAGNLDGDYSYAFVAILHNNGSTVIDTMYPYGLTAPTRANNKQILLKDFWWVANDSLNEVDSMSVLIYRNKQRQKRIDNGDQLYFVDSIPLNDSASYSTVTFTDNVSDDALGDSITFSPNNFYGRDSLKVLTSRYYGAPGYIASNSFGTDNIFEGYPDNASDTTGFAYMVALVDTITGIASNASAPLFYNTGVTAPTSRGRVTINLPPLRVQDSGYFYNIYRAVMTKVQTDSAYMEDYIQIKSGFKCYITYDTPRECSDCTIEKIADGKDGQPRWRVCEEDASIQIADTTNVWAVAMVGGSKELGIFQYLAQVPGTTSTFIDSVSLESAADPMLYPFYAGGSAPVSLDNLFTFQGRMWGTFRSSLYWSDILDKFNWGSLQHVDINPNDGDVITSAWPTRTAIRIFKNNSSHNVYPGIDNQTYIDWQRTEVTGYLGCIAPKSHASGIGGHYYLSSLGVIHETEGPTLERTFSSALVSEKLDNFGKISLSDKQNSVGFYFDRKYMLSVPNDTTYVYDERIGGWSTWSLSFNDAVLFNTTNGSYSDSMYFIKGTDELYRYGGVEYDKIPGLSGTAVVEWESAPILIDDFVNKITALGYWSRLSNQSGGEIIQFKVYDELDTVLTTRVLRDFSHRYYEFGVKTTKSNYFTLNLKTALIQSAFNIDKINIFYTNEGKLLRK